MPSAAGEAPNPSVSLIDQSGAQLAADDRDRPRSGKPEQRAEAAAPGFSLK
jgi:hypothetical protein